MKVDGASGEVAVQESLQWYYVVGRSVRPMAMAGSVIWEQLGLEKAPSYDWSATVVPALPAKLGRLVVATHQSRDDQR